MTSKRNSTFAHTFVNAALVASYRREANKLERTPASMLSQESSNWAKREWANESWSLPLREGLLRRFLTLLPGRPVGFQTGLRLMPCALGDLGGAIASAPTLGDAIMQCRRFWPIFGVGFCVEVEVADGQCRIMVDTHTEVDHRLRRLAIECLLAGIHRSVTALSGQRTGTKMVFDGPEPIYAGQIRARVGTLEYGADHSEYRFPIHLLRLRSTASDPERYRLAIDACLAQEAAQKVERSSTANLVRRHITLGEDGYPNFDDISRQIGIGTRTLRRRLKDEGLKFSHLLESVQFQDACCLLERAELDVGEVASLLGYRERANFSRAFRRWSGACPSQYRQELKRLALLTIS